MIKQALVGFVVASAVRLLLFPNRDSSGAPKLPTVPHPQLQWHLNGISYENAATTTPFVIIDDILPPALLAATLSAVEASTRTVGDAGDRVTCRLDRDGALCGEERWVDFDLDDARRYIDDNWRRPGGEGREGRVVERDLLEQAVVEIAKYDMVNVLPEHIAKHVKGVSWRILTSVSGYSRNVFHYDSDEDSDYAVKDVPLVHPLSSTVTYLNDIGEPTLILEQSQLSSDTERLYHPTAAYVSMPKANKHIAFDARLFHGSSSPMPKGKGGVRMAIGMNYHTSRSLETKPLTFLPSKAIPPIELANEGADDVGKHEAKVMPWNVKDNVSLGASRDDWSFFDLTTVGHGRDYLGDPYRPSTLSLRLPVSLIMSYDADRKPGCTLGIELTEGDFAIRPQKDAFATSKPRNGNERAREVATEMLRTRCEIFPHDERSMNPPLNARLCSFAASSE